jgi:Phosphodiester glycosidase
MRFLIPALFALPFASCSPAKPIRPVEPVRTASSPAEPSAPALPSRPTPSPTPSVSEPTGPAKVVSWEKAGVRFTGLTFDSRDHRLIVMDQPNGPGSIVADAAEAARTRGGVAAINAGFFTPEGAPLGSVVSSGKISGAWNSTSSLGSGIWYVNSSWNSAISRREHLGRNAAAGMRELIQAGPLLVENGRSVSGLESTKSSARSVILWDGRSQWWIGCSTPCTLDALAQSLVDTQATGWPIRQALNLDGGRSSDLWISDSVPGGPISQRPPWNRPVRNFLILIAK